MAGEATKDRFSRPGESGVYIGEGESGIKGRWEDLTPPEEIEVGHSREFKKKPRLPGGGVGAADLYESTGIESMDPEQLALYDEYAQALRDGFEGTFAEYLDAPESDLEWERRKDEIADRQERAEERRTEDARREEEAKKEKEGREFVHLRLLEAELNKFATPEEKVNFFKFYKLWKYGGEDIAWMGFEVGKSKSDRKIKEITGVSLVTEKGGKRETVTVSAHLFRSVMSNVSGITKPGTDVVNGLAFLNTPFTDERHIIHPFTDLNEAIGTMKRIKIDGKALGDQVKFYVGDNFQKEEK